jgi:uncharacterized protein YecE (DUF72 family)
MARPHVGLPVLQGDLQRYSERYDLLELRPGDATLPRPSTLRAWRKKVPPSFVFSVVLPKIVGELRPGKALDEALEESLAAARAVEARCLIIATPPSITPTELNRKRLAALVERIPHDAVTLCWEATGIWEREEADAFASKLGVVPVVDPAREPAPKGSIVYYRLRGLGESAKLSAAAIEKVAAELQDRREAYVIVETAGAFGVAQALWLQTSRRVAGARTGATLLRPRATLQAEDEEQ